jgi:hypothetical protein
MPKFSNGRITTNAIFYSRGVPERATNFGTYVAVNYEMLRQLSIYNRRGGLLNKNGRPVYSLF